MVADRGLKTMVGIIVAILASAAAYQASGVLAPLVLALFIIAIVWPLQRWLQSRMSTLLALAITLIVTISVFLAFASLVAWGFGRVGRSLTSDVARYQALYSNVIAWLEAQGFSVAEVWAEHFNVTWLLRVAQQLAGRVNTTLTFWIVTLVYVLLGLLEVDDTRRKVEALSNPDTRRLLLTGTRSAALKFRRYMLVRTLMSALTGLLVWGFAWLAGLSFAAEWGVIAFALNYIPFIGPFIATLFPTLLAISQFDTWQSALGVFVCLNIIQFVVGSYVEPRVAGNLLSISPTLVLFAIFFWTFLWGLFGTFIGVPITIAILTFCSQHPSTRWVADLLGKPSQEPVKPAV
jgi:AI-2 transport protein TqsA